MEDRMLGLHYMSCYLPSTRTRTITDYPKRNMIHHCILERDNFTNFFATRIALEYAITIGASVHKAIKLRNDYVLPSPISSST